MPDDASIHITQKRFLAGGQELTLDRQKGKLSIRTRKGFERRELSFNLTEIDPDPTIIRITSYSYLFCTIFLGLASVGSVILAIIGAVHPKAAGQENPFIWASIFFSTITLFAFREFRNRSLNVAQFVSYKGGHFPVWNKLPSADVAAAFIAELRESITEARTDVFSSQNETLANEIRGLDKLRASGVLTEEEFKNAKARLLGLPAGLPEPPEDTKEEEKPRTEPLKGPGEPGLN